MNRDALLGRGRTGSPTLGLPGVIRACLFDMDGVLTQTATLHTAAWKQMFDAYLRDRSLATGERFAPFDAASDYEKYVDGKLRADGARSFLASRGIHLSDGEETDPPDAETVNGLARRKDNFPSSPEAGWCRDLRRVGPLCPGSAAGGPSHGGRLVEQALP